MPQEPHLGRLHPGPALGAVLYALLAASLVVALLGQHTGAIPPRWVAVAPLAFALFLLLFALYRFVLVRAGRYPFGRALFQVGAGVLFLAVLFQRRPPEVRKPRQADLPSLLAAKEPLLRQLGCELARYRPGGKAVLGQLERHAQDDVPRVRAECARSVRALKTAGKGRP